VLVDDSDEVMLISTGGVLIRTKASDISEVSRSTQGVTLIALDAGTKLAGIEKILETDEVPANGNGTNGNGEETNSGDAGAGPDEGPAPDDTIH